MTLRIIAQPLTAEAFAPFGDVIESEGQHSFHINDGNALRFHDVAKAEFSGDAAHVGISLVDVAPYQMPLAITLMEKHPKGSQAFIPLDNEPFLVMVAPRGPEIKIEEIKAFITNGRQGINYHTDSWHHPLVSLKDAQRFIIVDRIGKDDNCDLFHIEAGQLEVALS